MVVLFVVDVLQAQAVRTRVSALHEAAAVAEAESAQLEHQQQDRQQQEPEQVASDDQHTATQPPEQQLQHRTADMPKQPLQGHPMMLPVGMSTEFVATGAVAAAGASVIAHPIDVSPECSSTDFSPTAASDSSNSSSRSSSVDVMYGAVE